MIEKLRLQPLSLRDARRFVTIYHRHHLSPQGGKFAVGVSLGDDVVGVAIVGRPVSRRLDDGWTAEVIRLCTLGHKNACSMLYAASWRAAKGMGYGRLITYILQEETGASLYASGWTLVGQRGGGEWNRTSRPRLVDRHPNQAKIMFERKL